MEDMEEAARGPPKDLTINNIVKKKRTKRQRVQSPIPFSIPTPSNSTEENDDDDQEMYNPSSSEFDEEEEEMANCLILLAQGYRPRPEEHRQYVSKRYTSKKYIESDGKEGVYVYQCKTCDRVFPSFQALGGHRASHKKPKGGVVEERKIQRQLSFLSEDLEDDQGLVEGGERKVKARSASTNSLVQLQLLGGSFSKSSPKVHECGICGAEFSSGQALGGHMRRHRVAVTTTSVATAASLTLVSRFDSEADKEVTIVKKSKSLLSLDLDLNLPAPTDEEKYKQQQQQQQQQQQNQNQTNLVLSTATLVDCHY